MQLLKIHSVSEYKKRYIRNYAQILKNLRNAIVGFFGLRNKFVSVQGNKKRNTHYIQELRNSKKYVVFDDGSDEMIREADTDDVELFFVDKPKRSQGH